MISSLPSIARARELMLAGQLSPVELVDFCLRRIQDHDEAIRAWVMVDAEGARFAAKQRAAELADGKQIGPLHGIPIGIKDIIDVAAWPTKAGSPLREDHVANQDAPVVTRLREAGAIILGKTVTTEFAGFDPPPTRNPWNFAHTPGGSSSGSAVAVAMQMCMAALGSQTGGSIIRPASYCGVAGLKPSFHAVDRHGVVPISGRLDHVGPIARRVDDLEAVFAVIADRERKEILADADDPRLAHSLRVIREFFAEQASQSVLNATERTLSMIGLAAGSERTLKLPNSFERVHQMHRRIMAVDAAAYHREAFHRASDQFGKNIASMIREGLETSADDYAEALEHQDLFKAEIDALFGSDIVAVTSATNTTAPASIETTGDSSFQAPWSYAGLPTVSIPCGLDENGMPCAIQFIGRRDHEFDLLSVAKGCEERIGFDREPAAR